MQIAMKKRLLCIKVIISLLFILISMNLHSECKYDKRINNYKKAWAKLIPSYTKIQYGGGMGLLSFGTGWDYGKKNQGETDIFFGFLPKYSTDKAKATFTLKQSYIPWSVQLTPLFSIEPFSCGGYFNTIFGSEFWSRQPHKYPKGYYQLPSKIRIHIFMGQRITFLLSKEQRYLAKSISLYYELSTSDILLISRIGNGYLRPRDYLRLSFGLKLHLF